MRGGWRLAVLPPALLALVFASVARAGTINFDFYPKDAQECLYKAADDSNCDSGTVETTNQCLCSNGGNFVTKTAECLGQNDKKDLSEVYLRIKELCAADSHTPLTVLEEQYLASAGVSEKTLTSVVPTPTKSPSSTSDAGAFATSTQEAGNGTGGKETDNTTPGDQGNNGKDNSTEDRTKSGGSGMSTGAKSGIIAGAVVGGLAVLGALGFFIYRYRRRRDGEESHPMLPPENGHMSLVPTAAETSALMAIDTPKGDWPNDAKWRPTSNEAEARKSAFNWESPYDLAYPGSLKVGQTPSPPGSPPGSPPRSGVFELQGSDRQPAEAPGVPLETGGEAGVLPVPRASATTSNRYSGSEWTEINPEPETPARSRANSSR
ncbi:hypothetical protein V8F20_012763 [Naviculisporaceae sp. PSN 640]